jgi:hypothetical protein
MNSPEILAPGILVYRNVFSDSMNLINRLEECLSQDSNIKGAGFSGAKNSTHSHYSWNQATTGFGQNNLKYRDCFDFKIKKNTEDNTGKSKDQIKLEQIWEDAKNAQILPIQDYCQKFNIAPLKYWEAFNFVKYGKDQHFQLHSDHGYSYICVLSSVGYINDDYEGGELFFDKFNLKIKPKAGDLYLFPSSYLFSHAAMPVTNGTKYSIVTMLDYLEAAHTPEYRSLEKKYNNGDLA